MTGQKYEHFTSGIFPKRKSINQISLCVRYNLLCYLWHNVLDRVESWCEVLEWSLGLMFWFGIIELYINEIFYEELFQCSTDLMDLHNNSPWPVFVASNNIYHESVSDNIGSVILSANTISLYGANVRSVLLWTMVIYKKIKIKKIVFL